MKLLQNLHLDVGCYQRISLLLSAICEAKDRQMGPAGRRLKVHMTSRQYIQEHGLIRLQMPRQTGNTTVACQLYQVLSKYEEVEPLLLITMSSMSRHYETLHGLPNGSIVSINTRDASSLNKLRGQSHNVIIIDAAEDLWILDDLLKIEEGNIHKYLFFCIVILGNPTITA